METLRLPMNSLTFGKVALVYESGYHMRVLEVVVVVGTKYVGWDDTCEIAAILVVISPLCVCVWERGGQGEGRGGRRGEEGGFEG